MHGSSVRLSGLIICKTTEVVSGEWLGWSCRVQLFEDAGISILPPGFRVSSGCATGRSTRPPRPQRARGRGHLNLIGFRVRSGPSIRFQDNAPAATDSDVRLSATCTDWLLGFAEAGALAKFFCPGTVAPATLARVYVSYMEKNPTLLDAPRGSAALLALVDAYPCPAK